MIFTRDCIFQHQISLLRYTNSCLRLVYFLILPTGSRFVQNQQSTAALQQESDHCASSRPKS